jgi:hypothetical protein
MQHNHQPIAAKPNLPLPNATICQQTMASRSNRCGIFTTRSQLPIRGKVRKKGTTGSMFFLTLLL